MPLVISIIPLVILTLFIKGIVFCSSDIKVYLKLLGSTPGSVTTKIVDVVLLVYIFVSNCVTDIVVIPTPFIIAKPSIIVTTDGTELVKTNKPSLFEIGPFNWKFVVSVVTDPNVKSSKTGIFLDTIKFAEIKPGKKYIFPNCDAVISVVPCDKIFTVLSVIVATLVFELV